jgi:hypothetical protein
MLVLLSIDWQRHDATVYIVLMVVMMRIHRKPRGAGIAKQTQIFGVARHRFRLSRTANMLIQAQHLIGRCHHQMQIMRHHDHAIAMRLL